MTGPLFVFVTGASGAGKTTLLQAFERQHGSAETAVAYFDSLGVPPPEQMVRDHGSAEAWQRVRTVEWVDRLLAQTEKSLLVLEGQFNPHFAADACTARGIANYHIIAVHCDDAQRDARLINNRQQGELATDAMRHWAQYIKTETQALGGTVLESTDDVSVDTAAFASLIARLRAA